jgi:hypothetical protein
MAIPNKKLQELHRLEAKTLDNRFITEITTGLNCSPFEARAILQVVHEVYLPHLGGDLPTVPLQPGQMALIAVDADEPGGKPLQECQKVTVRLTINCDEDHAVRLKEGHAAYRQARIPDLCQQALSQGGLLTREDLAYQIFHVDPRTISRDLLQLRKSQPEALLPLRSNKHDIGPVLTHRVRIIELVLEGKTFSQIQSIMRHSPEAIANYVGTFVRTAQLSEQGLQCGQIAYLLRRGKGLIEKYIELLTQCQASNDKNRLYHLEQLMLSDGQGWSGAAEKKTSPQNKPQP